MSVRLLGDAGIGWHIRTGQQILATHTIPRVDSFSTTVGGKPWYAWEWLYDLAVGQLEATLGLNGVVCLTAVVIAAVFAWTFRLLIRRGTYLPAAIVLVLLATAASMIHFLARPHVVSWLFTLAWFWILESSEQKSSSKEGMLLWVLPLLMLVWVNVHGGFVVGFVLLAIFWVSGAWDWLRTKEGRIEDVFARLSARRRARRLAGVGLLSLAASLINPYGWKLHIHVYSYLSNRFLMDHIEEFRSPDFHGVAQKCFLGILLITLTVLAIRGRELRTSGGLTILFAVYAGLYASRSIPVSSVLLVMTVGPLLSKLPVDEKFFQKMTALERDLHGHAWPILVVVVTLLMAANGGRVGSSQLMNAHFDPRRMPVDAVSYLEKNEVKGPIFSPDYWGGYLIYRFYPHARVVVDDRHDLYGEAFFKYYLNMWRVEPGWENFLLDREIRCVVLPRETALAAALLESQHWKVMHEDFTAIVFARKEAVGVQ